MIKKYINKIKKHFEEVLRIKTTPKEIALGFSIGAFFANFPTFGLEFIIIILILLIFKRVSKISLILAYVVFNPLITYPMIILEYYIGNLILGDLPITIIEFTLFQDVIQFTIRYIVGSFVVATFISIVSYYVVYYISKRYQKNFKTQ